MNNKKTKKCVLISNVLRGGLGFPGLKLRSSFSTPLGVYWGLTAWYINMNLKGFVKTDEKRRNYRNETWWKQLKSTEKLLAMNKGRRKSSDEQLSLASLSLFLRYKKASFLSRKKISLLLAGFFLKLFGRAKKKEKLPNCDPSYTEDVFYHTCS